MQYVNSDTRSVTINKTLSDTYKLLAMNFLFAGVMGFVGMLVNMPVLSLVVSIGLLGFLIFGMRNIQPDAKGVMITFLVAGALGFSFGPMIGYYLSVQGGSMIVMQAFVATAAIFAALSVYAIVSKKDFSFLGGFIIAGFIIAIIGGIAMALLGMRVEQVVFSGIGALASAALILFETSRVVKSGETNYVLVTIGLFVAFANIFSFLLQILGMNSND